MSACVSNAMSLVLHVFCPSCKCDDVVTDYASGDIICRGCALVIGDRIIDSSEEWNNYANDDRGDAGRQARASTRPGGGETQSYITGGTKAERDALTKTSMQSAISREDLKIQANSDTIHNLSFKLGLTDVIMEKAIELYRSAIQRNVTKLRVKDVLVAAVIYLACRMEGFPRTLKEIAAAANLPMKSISKIYTTLSRTLEVDPGRVLPEDIVSRFGSQLQLSHMVRFAALHICQAASRHDVCEGTSPHNIAAASLAMSMILHQETIDIEALAHTSMGNVGTIRKTYVVLRLHASKLVPQEYLKEIASLPEELQT